MHTHMTLKYHHKGDQNNALHYTLQHIKDKPQTNFNPFVPCKYNVDDLISGMILHSY